MSKVTKAVIPVAGYGTRFLPYTKAVPKAMLPILNKPAIQIITDEVVSSGITDILFIVGYKSEIIKAHFEKAEGLENMLLSKGKKDFYDSVVYPEHMAKISYVEQTELNGTGGAISLARDFVKDEPFAVLFGDDVMFNDYPVIKQLIDVYDKTGKTVIGCKTVPHEDVPKYASVEYSSKEGNVYTATKITEKPKLEDVKSDLSPLGRYVCAPGLMDVILKLKPAVNGEIQFTDALDVVARQNKAMAVDFVGTRYDMGNYFGFLKANIEAGLRNEEISEKLKEYLKEIID